MQGQVEEGMACMRQGLAIHRATGVKLACSHELAELAAACAQIGQVDQGLALLTEALEELQRSGERYYEAEIHRLTGELLLMQQESVDEAEVEGHYRRAIDVARRQSEVLGAAGGDEFMPFVAQAGSVRRRAANA